MLISVIVATVQFCARHKWAVIIAALVLAAGSGFYAKSHFAVDANVNNLISRDLPWRQRELDYQAAFPQTAQLILVVIDAPTAEEASAATRALAAELLKKPDLFRSVEDEGGGPFFERNGLLYLPLEQVEQRAKTLTSAEPVLDVLVKDPSLRGLMQALSYVLAGVKGGEVTLDGVAVALNTAAETVESVATSQPASFSWDALTQGNPDATGARRLLAVVPVLDAGDIEPGRKATQAIRQSSADLQLAAKFGADVRVTGPVPIDDEEFASVQKGFALNGAITGAIVIIVLWAALRSLGLVLAVVATLGIGLIVTAGLGIFLVGAMNPISLAFAILFVGLGADFAVQFSLRYRAQRHFTPDLRGAVVDAARLVGVPLTLAAAAAAVGFFSFTPTAYAGLAQLGKIAGCGIIIAYLFSFTLLPALLVAARPPKEGKAIGQPALAPIDRFLERRRTAVIVGTLVLLTAGLPALQRLRFDLNPLHLQVRSSQAISTLKELSGDPAVGVNDAQVLARSHDDAVAIAKKLAALPEVAATRTISSFIPRDQDEKLAAIGAAAKALRPALDATPKPPPTDTEDVAVLRRGADGLEAAAAKEHGPGAGAARRLARDITQLAAATPAERARATQAFIDPLEMDVAALRQSLKAQSVDQASLPNKLIRDWIAPDGRERVDVAPKGDANHDAVLRRFATAVLAAEPGATGTPIESLEWAKTMIEALIEAAAIAFFAIAILLWIALRRGRDMLLTLIPLMASALATLEICGLTGFRLNYANIIALPVVLGVGVAFKIYYITAWRQGQTDFLESALTRAVFFSALFTGTAFGSLWLSVNPGLSSMGKLLALSLACTLASAVLFQPALMGKPKIRI